MTTLVRTAQRVVNASPQEVFEMLARPERHCEFDGSDTVRGLVEGPDRLALGDRFTMQMKHGIDYTSTNEVVEFEEGRRIAWRSGKFLGSRLVLGGQVWRYELTDRGDGTTLVRESHDLTGARPARLLSRVSASGAVEGMRRTLERIASRFEG